MAIRPDRRLHHPREVVKATLDMKTSPAQTATAASPAILKRRVVGMGIDMLAMAAVWFTLRQTVGAGATTFAVVVVVAIAVFAVVQGETGVTPGKAVAQLQLVNEYGRPPGAIPALLRLAAGIVDYFPCMPLIGPLLIWFTPTHQRIGDTITRTYVVPKPGTEEPAKVIEVTPPPPTGPAPAPYRNEDERTDFNPIWDAKVNAYVQWDPAGKRWMQFDDASQGWTPIDAA
jgi:uncharacterized RDD family membrane protein YckC